MEPEPVFTGWLRQRGSRTWVEVLAARDATYEGAWAKLLDMAPRGVDLTVAEGDLDPNAKE
jgi:hypothetical protein